MSAPVLEKKITIHQSRCCTPETWVGAVNGSVKAELKETKEGWALAMYENEGRNVEVVIAFEDFDTGYKLLRRYMNGYHDENNPRVCTSGSCHNG